MNQKIANLNVHTVGEAVSLARQRLDTLSESAALDSQVMVAHIINRKRAWLLAHPEAELSEAQAEAFEAALARLKSGEPLPYVLGKWEFYGLSFLLTADVLIPRPETELLVDAAISWLKGHPGRRRAADVGAGSGCIAVSLAVNVPDLYVLATDISNEAVDVVRSNVQRHAVGKRVRLQQGDLLQEAVGEFDLICANLPYIATETLKTLAVYRREPTQALDGGERGLKFIAALLNDAPRRLAPQGLMLLEIDASQGDAASDLAVHAFPRAAIEVQKDLNGQARLLSIQI